MSPPLARTDDVRRRFGDVFAVDGVTLEVATGEVVGLLGANGAGKTTLIRMLLGLLAPTAGRVELFGEAPSRATRRRLGYVPQGLGLYEDLTAAENLAFSAAAFAVSPPPLDDHLAAADGELVRDLPLGLQRGLAFAEALAHNPELLVLDEPTSGVDPLRRARLWDRIRGTAEQGVGVLITTHNMDEAEQCDRLVVMAAGRVAADGTIDAIVGDRRTVEVRTERWEAAFTALDEAEMTVVPQGRVLRVTAARCEDVRSRLVAAGVDATLRDVPATFEESFLSLTSSAA
jgi:ABC-2 type transport system ATP-binding protein